MAYRIDYGPPIEISCPPKYKRPRLRVMTAICLLLFVLGVRWLWPEGRQTLQRVLLPEYVTHTQVAFQDMIGMIQSGESAADAVTAFCREVIEHGQTSD